MVIGVSIDGVIRNLLEQIEETHKKYFFEEDGEPIKVKDYELDKWVTFPDEEVLQGELLFNPEFNEETFLESEENTNLVKSTTKVTLEEFLYEKCTVEIFGYADETISSAVETLNQLILDNPNHEFILLSREGGLAVPSTLFFLAKTKSICTNIKFVTEYSKVWDYVDVMITDHPKILNSKPEQKLSVIIDKEYNQDITKQFGVRIKTIKEIDARMLDGLESALNGNKVDWIS
jgi:hypothetical protein